MTLKRRIFFTLIPNKKILDDIKNLQEKFDCQFESNICRWVVIPNIHMTLCFIGYVDDILLSRLAVLMKNLSCQSIKLNLDSIGHFKKPKILWLGSSQENIPLQDLHNEINKKVADCAQIKLSQSFRPHITLARNVHNTIDIPAFDSIEWASDYFYLVESIQILNGVSYEIIEEYPLNC